MLDSLQNAAMQESQQRVKALLMEHEELKQDRLPVEQEWRQINDYILPRRNFHVTKPAGAIRQRNVLDNTGIIANERLAAVLYGFLMSPSMPWVMPKLLDRDPDHDEQVWFDHVAERMHQHFTSTASHFRVHMAEDMLDSTAFGSSVMWIGGNGRSGPLYRSIPLSRAWWKEDENGAVNTLHRTFTLTLNQARAAYPKSDSLKDMAQHKSANMMMAVEFLHVVRPRQGGRAGAANTRKPFEEIIIYVDKQEIVRVSGYETFPYGVGRMAHRESSAYGYGPAWAALPDVRQACVLTEALVRNVDRRADPPVFSTLPNAQNLLDMRPGAITAMPNLYALGANDINQVVQTLKMGGDVGIGENYLQYLHQQIQFSFYIDWLRPHEGPARTATEITDNRDLRLRAMAPLVARLEQEKLNNIVERTFFLMQSGGHFAPPPPSLDQHMIGFEYRSPIALAQRQSEVEGMMRTLDFAAVTAQFDPKAVNVLDTKAMLRAAARANGQQAEFLRAPSVVAAMEAQDAAAANDAQALDQVKTGAQALQAGGQGLANLNSAGALQPANAA